MLHTHVQSEWQRACTGPFVCLPAGATFSSCFYYCKNSLEHVAHPAGKHSWVCHMFQAIFAIVKTAGKRGTSWQTHKRASASSLPLALYVCVQHFVVHQCLSVTRQDVFTIVKTGWQTWYKPAQKLAGKRGTTWQNIQTRYIYDRKQHIVLCCELTLIMVNIACL